MNHQHPCPFVSELPLLSDHTATLLIDALQQFTLHLEAHYSNQIRRHHQQCFRDQHPEPPLGNANSDAPF